MLGVPCVASLDEIEEPIDLVDVFRNEAAAPGHAREAVAAGAKAFWLQLDLRSTGWSGKDAEERLHAVGLTTNRNTVPFDERPPTIASGIRVGTPAATMRGFDDEDFREVGRIIVDALGPDADLVELHGRATALCDRRPLYPGFRGYPAYVADGDKA